MVLVFTYFVYAQKKKQPVIDKPQPSPRKEAESPTEPIKTVAESPVALVPIVETVTAGEVAKPK